MDSSFGLRGLGSGIGFIEIEGEGVRVYGNILNRDYIRIMGICSDSGIENGSYCLGFRVHLRPAFLFTWEGTGPLFRSYL